MIERNVPTNKYLCDGSIWDIEPSDFGIHKLNYIVIRSRKDTRNNTAKNLLVLPDCFNGKINKMRHVITTERGYNQRSVDIFNREVVRDNKQAITTQEMTMHHVERHRIYLFQRNELIEDLKIYCEEKFPHSEIFIDGFETEVPNDGILGEGDIITQVWGKEKIVKKGDVHGLRMQIVNGVDIQENIEYFSNAELRRMAGVFRHGGLMEETCKIHPKDNGIGCTID